MAAFGEFFDHLSIKRGDIVRCAARDQAAVGHDFLINPICAGTPQIRFDGRKGSHPPVRYAASFDQSEWSVADRGNRLATFHKGAHKRDGLLIHAQRVGTQELP